MATGIPRQRAIGLDTERAVPTEAVEAVLQYEGKEPEEDILAGPRGAFARAWPLCAGVKSCWRNRMYFGENLAALRLLLDDPEVRGRVRLVYIDPPFATRSVFRSRNQIDAYSDLLVGAHYLEFLRKRLVILKELLADDGSIYVHLDDKMACHAKVVMDEVFGSSRFRNLITRKKCNPKNYTRKAFGNVADFVLFYSKSDDYVWNRAVEPWTRERALKEYEYVDPASGRRYKKVPVHAPGVRNGETGKPWRGKLPPPGKHWQYTPATLDEMDARGDIYWSPNGNPRRKVYLDQSEGVPVQDIWLGFRDAHNQNIKITGYPTEKNQELLRRVIDASSNEGDLVLDCFSGSGTTLDVASSLGRRWIGVDSSLTAVRTTLRRFAHGLSPMGDFVTPRQEPSRDGAALPLFGQAEDEADVPAAATNRPSILDFDLWVESSLAMDAEPLVEEWGSIVQKTAARPRTE
ncbi:MAG: site-specific DNA-methyltransferase [Vicinamibacterales bacterium]